MKEVMLIEQVNKKSAMFVTIDIFQIKDLGFKCIFAAVVMIY